MTDFEVAWRLLAIIIYARSLRDIPIRTRSEIYYNIVGEQAIPRIPKKSLYRYPRHIHQKIHEKITNFLIKIDRILFAFQGGHEYLHNTSYMFNKLIL